MLNDYKKAKYLMSFEERSYIAKQILSKQAEISYAEALAQVERLKKISTTESSLKKTRPQF